MRALTWGVLALLAAVLIGVAHGPVPMPLGVVVSRLLHPGNDVDSLILWQIRLPRVAAAALVGGGLAVAGAMMQALLRNPLADPYVVGASSGAGLGAIVTDLWLGSLAPLGAFIGALGAVLISFFLARSRGTLQVLTLILAGYAVGVMLSAIAVFLMLLNQQNLTTIFAWEVGGLHGVSWGPVEVAAALILSASVLAWFWAPQMNALLLGEEHAEYLGVRVEWTQVWLLLWASLLTAAAVYLAGLIGFVGLVVPHMLRRRVGPDHRWLVPLALLWGAAFLVLADTLAESLPVLGTVPVGLVTAFLGGPYFLWLLVRTQREGVIF
jgi:iron complex transport system permease protein